MKRESSKHFSQAKQFFRKGDFLGAYDETWKAIELEGDSFQPELVHFVILSLARGGMTRQALQCYDEFDSRFTLPKTEDFLSLKARLYKDAFLDTPRRKDKRAYGEIARDLYIRAFKIDRGYYPAINVASLSLWLDDLSTSRLWAKRVLGLCKNDPLSGGKDDYYHHATQAEALLLLKKFDEFPKALQQAKACNPCDHGNLSTTYRQLLRICKKLKVNRGLVETIRPPAVICYTGHMVHGLGKTPGVNPKDERSLRKLVRNTLMEQNVGIAFGSLACGADIWVAEEVLKLGGELNLIFPFGKKDFKHISVSPAGAAWDDRFERVFQKAASVSYVVDHPYSDHNILFEACSMQIMGAAYLRSHILGSRVFQLAIWNGLSSKSGAGTAADMKRWSALGLETLTIRVPSPGTKKAATARLSIPGKRKSKRQLRAMIFADIKGYSKLQEDRLPAFVSSWFERLSGILRRYSKHIHYVNTWGDAVFMVVDKVGLAARISIELAAFFPPSELRKHGMPDNSGLRVAAHVGPIFVTKDPLSRKNAFFGPHVVKTARLEPCTPVRSVYVTEPFAALLSLECKGQFRCEYVGNQPLPKGYGSIRMYHLKK